MSSRFPSSSRRVPAVCPLFPTLLLLPFDGDMAWVVVDVAAFGAPAAAVTWRLCMSMWVVMWWLCASMWAVTWWGMGVAGGAVLGGRGGVVGNGRRRGGP